MNNVIDQFIKSLNTNAPLSKRDGNYSLYKFPYKPILLISLIYNINDVNVLFNHNIDIDKNTNIVRTYYDLLMNSPTVYQYLNEHNAKERWFLTFNNKVRKQVIQNIFDCPAAHLSPSTFWEYNKKTKTIRINYVDSEENLIELRDKLLKSAIKCLYKCIPDYQDLSLNEIINYEQYINQCIITKDDIQEEPTYIKEEKGRRYQHIFKKIIFARDLKCKICCLDVPELLQAAHIRPYSQCNNIIEKYDETNGILLCANHHKLFDCGYFSFDDEWKVLISSELFDSDQYLIIKTFEPCYFETFKKTPNLNPYVEYHRQHIFRK